MTQMETILKFSLCELLHCTHLSLMKKTHGNHMWFTCVSHVVTCDPHVTTCESHVIHI